VPTPADEPTSQRNALANNNEREPVLLRVSTAVFRGGTVLLCRRLDDREPTWVLPGGTPRRGEGAANCARREVAEETGLHIDPDRVAFVLETTSPDASHHLMEIVFMAELRDASVVPAGTEPHLEPEFIELDRLGSMNLLPPIAGYLRGLSRRVTRLDATHATAAYLGNIWRSTGAASGAMEIDP
jgi:ADP-ribose pyrophosphatase YjhB (NUDIX family)